MDLAVPIQPRADNAWKARLDNQSWFSLRVSSPAGTTYLAPFSSVLVEAKSGPASVHVDVIAQTAGSLSGITPQLLATWAQAPDDVPAVSAGAGNPTPPFFRFRDEFYWPAISGENFPPVFGGAGAGYSSVADLPMWVPTGAGNTSSTVTFPMVPRVNANLGLRSLLVSLAALWFGAPDGGHPDPMFRFIYGGNPTIGFSVPKATARWNAFYNLGAGNVSVDLGVSMGTSTPDLIQFTVDPTGFTTWYVNGVSKLTVPAVWAAGRPTSGLLPVLTLTTGSINFATTVASQLRFAYS